MKFDKNKAFPYPVLRPYSDDYKEVEFQATVEFKVGKEKINAIISYAISSEEIEEQITLGNAEFIAVISCRDTYFQAKLNSRKEHRKRNASGALCDDPRIAVGPGVLTELQRERKRSQHARQSDTASSHLGSRDARRTGGELCIVANRGRIRAAEGIGGRVKFLPLAWAGMPKTSFRKNSDSLPIPIDNWKVSLILVNYVVKLG